MSLNSEKASVITKSRPGKRVTRLQDRSTSFSCGYVWPIEITLKGSIDPLQKCWRWNPEKLNVCFYYYFHLYLTNMRSNLTLHHLQQQYCGDAQRKRPRHSVFLCFHWISACLFLTFHATTYCQNKGINLKVAVLCIFLLLVIVSCTQLE